MTETASAKQEIVLVVARADNGVIGREGQLPWHLPADLKHFKQVTMGRPMIMGRRTFESLPGLLPGRKHIVLTRDKVWHQDGADVAHSTQQALDLAGPGRVSIVGGAEIIALFLPQADQFELTEIHMDADGDTFMPAPDPAEWREVSRETHPAAGDLPGFSFVQLVRRA